MSKWVYDPEFGAIVDPAVRESYNQRIAVRVSPEHGPTMAAAPEMAELLREMVRDIKPVAGWHARAREILSRIDGEGAAAR